jgi:hypothetical protein
MHRAGEYRLSIGAGPLTECSAPGTRQALSEATKLIPTIKTPLRTIVLGDFPAEAQQ